MNNYIHSYYPTINEYMGKKDTTAYTRGLLVTGVHTLQNISLILVKEFIDKSKKIIKNRIKINLIYLNRR